MSIGTITVGNQGGWKPSAPSPVIGLSFAGDGDYLAGGTAILAAVQAKLNGAAVEILGIEDVAGLAGFYPVWDATAAKLKVFVRTTGVEVADHVDLSGSTFKILALCR
jgi:hypothetical protein